MGLPRETTERRTSSRIEERTRGSTKGARGSGDYRALAPAEVFVLKNPSKVAKCQAQKAGKYQN